MNGFTRIDVHHHNLPYQDILSKNFLLLTDIAHTPPHCSLLCKGWWYSLNYHTRKIHIPLEVLYKKLEHKKEQAILLQLNLNLKIECAQYYFSQYHKVNFSQNITCISPIKDILIHHHIGIYKHFLLFEMIDVLLAKNLIGSTIGINYSEKEYILHHYTLDTMDIHFKSKT